MKKPALFSVGDRIEHRIPGEVEVRYGTIAGVVTRPIVMYAITWDDGRVGNGYLAAWLHIGASKGGKNAV